MANPEAARPARSAASVVQGAVTAVFLAAFNAVPLLDIVRDFRLPPWASAGLDVLFALLAASMLAGRNLAFLHDRPWARLVYRVSMLWVVLVLNLVLASAAHGLLRGVLALAGSPVPATATYPPFAAAAVLFTAWGLANARRLAVRRVPLEEGRFPASWAGRRAVFFSDTHYGSLNGPGRARQLVRRIAGLRPDLILFGGDLFDGPGGETDAVLEALGGLSAPLGVWGVIGNHDYFYLTEPGSSGALMAKQRAEASMPDGPGSPLRRMMDALPWRFLENEAVRIDGLVLAGLKAFSRADREAALAFLGGLDPGTPTILLNHKPRQVDEAVAAGVDLQLSGHTHGGPIFPINLVMRRMLEGRHFGTTRHGRMTLDTSSGSGVSSWYPRTAGRHEIVVLEFPG